MTGFEPATPRPPAECSTELSHIPILCNEPKIQQRRVQSQLDSDCTQINVYRCHESRKYECKSEI